MALKRAVFIDKDGTLIPDIPYNVDPEVISLSPGAGETLRRLQRRGYLLIVVSNQSGIARGLFRESALSPVRDRLDALLREHGASLDGFYYCPHLPPGEATVPVYARNCDCRKPQPGMLLRAARIQGIDLARSWMIGDIAADREAGLRAGCRTILIEKPYDPIIDREGCIVSTWREAGEIMKGDDDEYSRDSRTLRRC